MRPSALEFRPRWVPTLATLLVMAVTGYLGQWQQGRAEEKRQLQAENESRGRLGPIQLNKTSRASELRFRAARAVGRWHASGPVFVDNRVHGGRAGFYVLAPLELQDGGLVLVQRGWIARDASYPKAPAYAAPQGTVHVTGRLDVPSARFVEWTTVPAQGNVWQNLTPERFRSATGLDVLPFLLVEDPSPANLAHVAVEPAARAGKHVEYMWTWYALCMTALVLWVMMNLRLPATRVSRADES
ncbi:MAG: SURF1 family protein [Betaproteobacteria bacterium]|nr:SURF1 family protein [Betaproteobacteria bacterium]